MKRRIFGKPAALCALIAAASLVLSGCAAHPAAPGAGPVIYAGDPQSAPETQYDYSAWGGVLAHAAEAAPDAETLVIGGDLVNEYTDEDEWAAFFEAGGEALARFGERVYPVSGNHTSDAETTGRYFDLPESGCPDGLFYSFNAGDIHFLMLDSIAMGTRDFDTVSRIAKWMEDDLTENGGRWNIAVLHHPMYPVNGSMKDGIRAETMRENYLPILEAGGVCAVLCGHEHAYCRTEADGILQIMGVSGGKLYALSGDAPADFAYWDTPVFTVITAAEDLTFDTYDINGALIDSAAVEAGK